MLLSIFVFLILIFVIAELIPMYKDREWKVSVVYTFIMSLVLAAVILIEMETKVPSAFNHISRIVSQAFGLKNK